jgi:hypothetical protein
MCDVLYHGSPYALDEDGLEWLNRSRRHCLSRVKMSEKVASPSRTGRNFRVVK